MSYLDIARRTLAKLSNGHEADGTRVDLTDASAVWQAALVRLEGDPAFPPDLMEAMRSADARWADEADEADEAGESIEVIAPPEPCPECGTLELWQTMAGNWRCLRCDPPATARRLRELAARLKAGRTDSPRMNRKRRSMT